MKVLQYLKGTINFSLNYCKVSSMDLIGLVDSDYAGNTKGAKSLTGYVFKLADQTSPISWTTTKQKLTATSTCNAEYVALSAAVDDSLSTTIIGRC